MDSIRRNNTAAIIAIPLGFLLGLVCFVALRCSISEASAGIAGIELDKSLSAARIVVEILLCWVVSALYLSKGNRPTISTFILAAIWALIGLAGKWDYSLGLRIPSALFTLVGSFVFFTMLIGLIDTGVDWIQSKQMLAKPTNASFFRTFICVFIVLLVCWLPYAIMLFPGTIAPNDTFDQLQQFYGITSHTSQMAGLEPGGPALSNHHPVFHTLLVGLFLDAGTKLGSANAGVFAFVVFQSIILASGIAYGFALLRSCGIPRWIIAACLILPCLAPMVGVLTTSLSKDTLFAGVFVWFVSLQMQMSLANKTQRPSIAVYIGLGFAVLFCCLLRSTAIYLFMGAALIGIVLDIKTRKPTTQPLVAGLATALLVIYGLYPMAGIAQVNPDEKWAVALQQIALCYIEHGDQMSPEQVAEIDRVLDTSTLAERYTDGNCDPVKNTRDHTVGTQVSSDTLRVWADCLLHHSGTCARAWLACVKDYFHPLTTSNWLALHTTGYTMFDGYFDESERLNDLGLNLSEQGLSAQSRSDFEHWFDQVLDFTPLLAFSMGTIVWATLWAGYRTIRRRIVFLAIPATAAVLLVATLLLSPATGLIRYVLPLYVATPLLVCACMLAVPNNEDLAISHAKHARRPKQSLA